MQQLGIQLTGDRHIGFSGAFRPDILWTDRKMTGECGRYINNPNADESSFHEIPNKFVAHSAYTSGLIKPDTVTLNKRAPRDAHAMCREHLYNQTCQCGIYAFKDLSGVIRQYDPDGFCGGIYVNVVTQVIGWGATAEYSKGWRFEFCRPAGITMIAGSNDPEAKTRLVQVSDDLGRFLRARQTISFRDPLPFEVEIPLHIIASMLSGKFQCPVNIVANVAELVSTC